MQNKLLTLNFHEKELFYSKYYSQIVHRSKIYLIDLTENTSKNILMKLADVLQAALYSNLYINLKNSKTYQSEECQ